MRLIKWIFKSYPALVPDDFSDWLTIPLAFMPVNFEDFQLEAISTALYGSLVQGECSEFCGQLSIILENSEFTAVVAKCFKSIRVLISRQLPVAPEHIRFFIDAGFAAMDGKMKCQEDGQFNAKSSQYVYNFFRCLFDNDPEFPLDKLAQHGRKLLSGAGRSFEISQYISLLQHCYEAKATLPTLVKKTIMANFTDAFERYLALFQGDEASPFSVAPSPLAAIRAILEREPALLKDAVPGISSLSTRC
jgi:hypothetical protein